MTPVPLPLVIGIGNPLRRDDGVGWRLAAEWGLLQGNDRRAEALAVQQLLPELAETVAKRERVLFIDAAVDDGSRADSGDGPWLQPLHADGGDGGGLSRSHSLEPALLLALAAELYGHSPEAHRLLLIARQMAHGTAFSAPVRRQLPIARQLLQSWLEAGDA